MKWNWVVFSNESRFCLGTDNDYFCLWRPSGQHLIPAFVHDGHTVPSHIWFGVFWAHQLNIVIRVLHVTPIEAAFTAGVMAWVAITYSQSLAVIQGTLTAQGYVKDILQPQVVPLMGAAWRHFLVG